MFLEQLVKKMILLMSPIPKGGMVWFVVVNKKGNRSVATVQCYYSSVLFSTFEKVEKKTVGTYMDFHLRLRNLAEALIQE